MVQCSNKDIDTSASQLSWWYVDISYQELKKGTYKVKNSDETFICPYCPERKQDYKYRELLNHASGVGRSSSEKRTAKEKANHLALVKYLEKDLAYLDGTSKPADKGLPVNEVTEQNFHFKYFPCYLSQNLPIHNNTQWHNEDIK